MLKKINRWALLSVVGLSFAAGDLSQIEAKEETLSTVSASDIGDINPHLYDTRSLFAQATPFEGLVGFDQEGEIIPVLAESWEVSEDGKTYAFQIREGVTFSDGEVLNGEAVAKNFQALLDNRERHAWMDIFNLIEKVEATGDYEFTMTLSEPYAATLNDLGNTRPFKIISPKQFVDGGTKDGIEAPIGTGAYVLGDRKEDEYFEFERNEDYWGDAPDVKKYHFEVMPDINLHSLALEKGNIDFLYGMKDVATDTFKEYKDKKGYTAELSDITNTRLLIFNSTQGPLNDPAVREALAYGVNREEMAESLFDGLEEPMGRLFSTHVPYADVELEDFTYDPDRVNKVLDDAGWTMGAGGVREKDGQTLKLKTYYVTTHADEKEMAEYLQASLQAFGIHLDVIGEESQAVRDRWDDGSYDILFRDTWGPTYDPYAFLGTIGSTQTSLTYSAQGIKDFKEVREKILNTQTTTDDKERKADFEYILKALHDQYAFIPLTGEKNRVVYNDRVEFGGFDANIQQKPLKDFKIK